MAEKDAGAAGIRLHCATTRQAGQRQISPQKGLIMPEIAPASIMPATAQHIFFCFPVDRTWRL
jgi:hypothetical protein